MTLSEIQDLIKFVSKTGIDEVEIEKKDFKITIKTDSLAKKKNNLGTETIVQQVPVVPQMMQQAVAQPQMQQQQAIPQSQPTTETDDSENYTTFKSPMIGTFYRSSSPDKPPFVKVGDVIKPGDILCIVEAMKLFNEIESEVSGKIVKILVDDTTPVEYDQPMFLIEPA